MSENSCKLTVFFEEPFWVGWFQRLENGCMYVCRVVFGAEPRDAEVYQYILQNWHRLRFGPGVTAQMPREIKNPKRRLRAVRCQMEKDRGVGTKAQQALQLQYQVNKQQRKINKKELKQEENYKKYLLRQEKKRKKHRGK